MKKFHSYIEEWESNAKKDAYWSVLTSSNHENNAWNKEVFFQTGIYEINALKMYLEKIGLQIPFQGVSLDFGCGVGRLTQAFSYYFHEVYGVDISQYMLYEAQRALSKTKTNITFLHNPNQNLEIFDSEFFDFIYSNIVLQHIDKKNQLEYLTEFARITKPGGWIIIQIPSKRLCNNKLNKVKSCLSNIIPYKLKKMIQVYMLKNKNKALKEFDFEINLCSENKIQQIAAENTLTIKHTAYTNSCDSDFGGNLIFFSYHEALKRSGFLSPMYFMQKHV